MLEIYFNICKTGRQKIAVWISTTCQSSINLTGKANCSQLSFSSLKQEHVLFFDVTFCQCLGLFNTTLLELLPEKFQVALAKTGPFPQRFSDRDEYAQLVEQIFENSMMNAETILLDGALRMQPWEDDQLLSPANKKMHVKNQWI